MAAAAYLVIAKFVFDGFERKFGDIVEISADAAGWILIAEEVMELTASILVAYATFYSIIKKGGG